MLSAASNTEKVSVENLIDLSICNDIGDNENEENEEADNSSDENIEGQLIERMEDYDADDAQVINALQDKLLELEADDAVKDGLNSNDDNESEELDDIDWQENQGDVLMDNRAELNNSVGCPENEGEVFVDEQSSSTDASVSGQDILHELVHTEGLNYIAGYVASRFKLKHDFLGTYTYKVPCKDPTDWIQYLSKGYLTSPSSALVSVANVMEDQFQLYHGNNSFNKSKGIFRAVTKNTQDVLVKRWKFCVSCKNIIKKRKL